MSLLTRLFGKGKVRIARAISIHHQRIARERRRYAKLLLLPIDVGDAVAGWWLDQSSKPHAWAEYELCVARLVAALQGTCRAAFWPDHSSQLRCG